MIKKKVIDHVVWCFLKHSLFWKTIVFCFYCSSVLHLDRWLECSIGKRDDQWTHQVRYGYTGDHGDKAPPLRPWECPNSWSSTPYTQRTKRLWLCIWFQPTTHLRGIASQLLDCNVFNLDSRLIDSIGQVIRKCLHFLVKGNFNQKGLEKALAGILSLIYKPSQKYCL